MPQRTPVADYLDALTRQLGFDRPLAYRVRQEVEDHLGEATAANGGSSIEAQARAVRCFGEAREIASQYAALSLLRQARRSGAIIVLASGALYIAMRGRVAWYGLMQWALSDAMQPVGKVVLAVSALSSRSKRSSTSKAGTVQAKRKKPSTPSSFMRS